MHQSEEDNNSFHGNGIEKLNQGSEFDGAKSLNPIGDVNNLIENDVDEYHASKKIHQFYFVKFHSYEDPELKARIEKAENLIRDKNEERSQIRENIENIMFEQNCMKSSVEYLKRSERNYSTSVTRTKNEVEFLRQAQKMLHPAKNASLGRAIGLFSSEEELNEHIQSLHYRILHGSNSLAEEKKLLREIKHVEGTREKVVASASKSKKWDSLTPEEKIQYQMESADFNLCRVSKSLLDVRAKIKRLQTEMEPAEKYITSLHDELKKIYLTKEEAHACIFEQRKQHDKVNACYYKYVSVLKNARELAEKKDVAALEELSHREVEKFMSEWSNSKAFRDNYEEKNLPSLDSRQLSRDGRMRNPNDKPLVCEATTHLTTETMAETNIKMQERD